MRRRPATLAGVAVLLLSGLGGLAGCHSGETGSRSESGSPSPSFSPLPSPTASSGPATDVERGSMTTFASQALTVALHRSPDAVGYDADVVEASKLMTDHYATRFRSLALATRNDVTGNKLSVQAHVIDAGVVAATPVEGRVLVFADQVTSGGDEDPRTTQQSVVVSVVRHGTGWQVSDLETSQTRGRHEPDADRRTVLRAATQVATLLVNIDYHSVDHDLGAITALGTGHFRDEYDDRDGDVVKELVDHQSVMTGLVFAAAVVTSDQDSATVLVATAGQVSNTSTHGLLVARTFRMEMHLTRDGDRWLADDLDFV